MNLIDQPEGLEAVFEPKLREAISCNGLMTGDAIVACHWVIDLSFSFFLPYWLIFRIKGVNPAISSPAATTLSAYLPLRVALHESR